MKFLVVLVLFVTSIFAETITDASLGYSIILPTNWVQIKARTNQHYFRDSTKAHKSQLSLVVYSIDKITYPTAESWTQAQFIAYMLAVENSVFPFGSVAFYDSAASVKLHSYWAPEAYSIFYPGNGDATYSEYLRYTANGNYGYEIYAIGDSTDMANNVTYYSDIISTIQFSTATVSIHAPHGTPLLTSEKLSSNSFNLIGRKLNFLENQTGQPIRKSKQTLQYIISRPR